MKQLRISAIRRDEKLQPRCTIDMEVVKDYAETIRNGTDLPPVGVVHDGQSYWLWDGYHRLAAYESAGANEVPASITQGTPHDAFLMSLSANATHGQRRTNADKRRAVEMALADEETGKLSTRQVATICAVSHDFVARVKGSQSIHVSSDDTSDEPTTSVEHVSSDDTSRVVGSDGKTYPAKKQQRAKEPPAIASEAEAVATDGGQPAPASKEGEPVLATNGIETALAAKADFEEALGVLTRFRTMLTEICKLDGGVILNARLRQINIDIDNVKAAVKFACPDRVCSRCGAAGCSICGMRGWLSLADRAK